MNPFTDPSPDVLHLTPDPAAGVAAGLQQLREQLPALDVVVLGDIAALGLMTARQVERLRFTEGSPLTQARRARRNLERLHHHGLVCRLDRRIGGVRAGSASFVYRITTKGRRLLALPGPHGGRHRQAPQPSLNRVGHVLAVSELAVSLHEAHRARRLDLLRFEAEPTSWRRYSGPAGEAHYIRPDAFLILGVGAWEHLWFVEVDLSSERLSVLRLKAAAYRHYAATGHEQARWATFPRVAYLTNTPARRHQLTHTLQREPLATVATLHDAVTVLAATTEPEAA